MAKDYAKFLKDALPFISLFVLTFLFFGFLIINIYLAQFGYWDFSFFSIGYAAPGVLFTVLAGITLWIEFAAIDWLHRHLKTWGAGFWSTVIILIISLSALRLIVIQLFVWLLLTIFIAIPIVILKNKKVVSTDKIEASKEEATISNSKAFLPSFTLFIIGLASLSYLVFYFATHIYAEIPHFYGGNSPIKAHLYFDESISQIDNPASLVQYSGQSISVSQYATSTPINPLGDEADVLILYQTSDFIFFKTQSYGNYSVKQSDVLAVHYYVPQ